MILFLHGNPTSGFMFRNTINALKNSYHCIAPDLIGFGKSDKPAYEGLYSLELHSEIISTLISVLDLRNIILVVHDWGGPIGFNVALADREKYLGLVILNTLTEPVAKIPVYVIPLLRLKRIYSFFIRQTVLFQKIAFNRPKKNMKDSELQFYFDCNYDFDSRAGIAAFPKMIPLSTKHPNYKFMKSVLSELFQWNIPMKVVFGDQDKTFSSRSGQIFASKLKDADFIVFNGCGHFVPEEYPIQLAREIQNFITTDVG